MSERLSPSIAYAAIEAPLAVLLASAATDLGAHPSKSQPGESHQADGREPIAGGSEDQCSSSLLSGSATDEGGSELWMGWQGLGNALRRHSWMRARLAEVAMCVGKVNLGF